MMDLDISTKDLLNGSSIFSSSIGDLENESRLCNPSAFDLKNEGVTRYSHDDFNVFVSDDRIVEIDVFPERFITTKKLLNHLSSLKITVEDNLDQISLVLYVLNMESINYSIFNRSTIGNQLSINCMKFNYIIFFDLGVGQINRIRFYSHTSEYCD